MFAEDEYDFLVGKAEYIVDKKEFFWSTILESHSLLEDVLNIEKDLSETIDSDKQYCYDTRREYPVWTQCPEYARAYHEGMNGMVEDRMRKSIISLGSVWYSAWIDAGQPDIQSIMDDIDPQDRQEAQEQLNKAVEANQIYGREH